MNTIKTVFFKELKRYFTDKRMLLSLFLPGIVIFIFYTLLGNFIGDTSTSLLSSPSDIVFRLAITDNYGSENDPYLIQGYQAYLDAENKNNSFTLEKISTNEIETYKEKVISNEVDVLISFSDNFDLVFNQIESKDSNDISIFYDGSRQVSYVCYSSLSALVGEIYNGYTVNTPGGSYVEPNLSGDNYVMTEIVGILFPAITISLLFSGTTAICPGAIAGEKERGTIASILLTPAKRSHIALGKIMALSLTAIASGLVSFLGLFYSLPSLIGGGFSYSNMGTGIPLLILLFVAALFLFTALGLMVSSLTKTTREASTYLGYMTGIFMVLSFVPGLVDLSNIGYAFLPIMNIAYCMSSIFKGNISEILPYLGITIGIDIVYGLVCVVISAKAFKSETLMLS